MTYPQSLERQRRRHLKHPPRRVGSSPPQRCSPGEGEQLHHGRHPPYCRSKVGRVAKEGERFEASVRHLARSAGLYWGVFGLYKGRELARKRKLSPLAAPPPSTNRILYLLVKILPRRSGGGVPDAWLDPRDAEIGLRSLSGPPRDGRAPRARLRKRPCRRPRRRPRRRPVRFTFSNTCSSSVFAKATDFEREPTARTIFREYSRSERPSDAFWLKLRVGTEHGRTRNQDI